VFDVGSRVQLHWRVLCAGAGPDGHARPRYVVPRLTVAGATTDGTAAWRARSPSGAQHHCGSGLLENQSATVLPAVTGAYTTTIALRDVRPTQAVMIVPPLARPTRRPSCRLPPARIDTRRGAQRRSSACTARCWTMRAPVGRIVLADHLLLRRQRHPAELDQRGSGARRQRRLSLLRRSCQRSRGATVLAALPAKAFPSAAWPSCPVATRCSSTSPRTSEADGQRCVVDGAGAPFRGRSRCTRPSDVAATRWGSRRRRSRPALGASRRVHR
jgi:hypothetical protein